MEQTPTKDEFYTLQSHTVPPYTYYCRFPDPLLLYSSRMSVRLIVSLRIEIGDGVLE